MHRRGRMPAIPNRYGKSSRRRYRLAPSQFNPLSITGLVAWYDFSDITTLWKDTARTSAVTADADVILGVTDKSGVAHHLSEATNGPVYKVNIQNGHSVARFDGTNDLLASDTIGQAQPLTVILVGDKDATNDEHFYDSVAGGRDFIGRGSNNWQFYGGSAVISDGAADTDPHIFAGIFSGASSKLYVAGGSATTGNPGTNSLGGALSFGLNQGGAFTAMDMSEWLLYSGALSATNLNLIGAHLAQKYSLVWTPVA